MKFELNLKNRVITDEELKEDVIRVMQLVHPLPLSSKKYDELGHFCSDTVARRFGQRSWNKALSSIIMGYGPAQKNHTEKELFDNIAKVWIAKLSQPVRRDMDTHPCSTISSGSYLRKYGKWNLALQKFVEYINSSTITFPDEVPNIHGALKHKTPREPSLRLKVQVLLRDGNCCKICGVKCDEGIHKIHFDHILPWSKGGETTLDNLRVLCKDCNEALGNTNCPNNK